MDIQENKKKSVAFVEPEKSTHKPQAESAVVDDSKKQPADVEKVKESQLFKYFSRALGISNDKPAQLLETVDIEGIAKYILSGKCKNIITMTGAGISTSAGIPDVRSPGTGLCDNLEKYNLPDINSIFEINFFRENPEPFFTLARELWKSSYKPTPSHYFLRMLNQKGYLRRHYTTNIDPLERAIGLEPDKLMEAHGTFCTSHCLDCELEYTDDWMKERVLNELIPTCTYCSGLVKPDITFFGEPMPPRFMQCVKDDFPKCDLLIVMGTSLVVQPFASVTSKVPETCPRLFINRVKSGCGGHPLTVMIFGGGFDFDSEDNYRDVFLEGNCDDGCLKLAHLLGFGAELEDLVKTEHIRLDSEAKKCAGATALKAIPHKVKSDLSMNRHGKMNSPSNIKNIDSVSSLKDTTKMESPSCTNKTVNLESKAKVKPSLNMKNPGRVKSSTISPAKPETIRTKSAAKMESPSKIKNSTKVEATSSIRNPGKAESPSSIRNPSKAESTSSIRDPSKAESPSSVKNPVKSESSSNVNNPVKSESTSSEKNPVKSKSPSSVKNHPKAASLSTKNAAKAEPHSNKQSPAKVQSRSGTKTPVRVKTTNKDTPKDVIRKFKVQYDSD